MRSLPVFSFLFPPLSLRRCRRRRSTRAQAAARSPQAGGHRGTRGHVTARRARLLPRMQSPRRSSYETARQNRKCLRKNHQRIRAERPVRTKGETALARTGLCLPPQALPRHARNVSEHAESEDEEHHARGGRPRPRRHAPWPERRSEALSQRASIVAVVPPGVGGVGPCGVAVARRDEPNVSVRDERAPPEPPRARSAAPLPGDAWLAFDGKRRFLGGACGTFPEARVRETRRTSSTIISRASSSCVLSIAHTLSSASALSLSALLA